MLDDRRLRAALAFLRNQLSAASFAIILLVLMATTRLWWPFDGLARYDALLAAAILVQIALLAGGWETWGEARVILIFHVVGTIMEIFKTMAGSWVYPEPGIFKLYGVPLMTGFMYSAVGSYIARSWRLMDMRLERAPPLWAMGALAAAIYVNFYSHHYVWDWRYALFGLTVALFWRSRLSMRLADLRLAIPPLALFLAVGLLIWVAENIATWANIWLYPPQQGGWRMVTPHKIGSWTLLMILSFALVYAENARAALAAPSRAIRRANP